MTLRRRDAGAIVRNVDAQGILAGCHRDRHTPITSRQELGGIRQQVQHDLGQAVRIGLQHDRQCGQTQLDARAATVKQLCSGVHGLLQELPQVDFSGMPLRVPRLDLRQVQNLVHQAAQTLGLSDDDAKELLALVGGHLRIIGHHLGQRPDRRQWCAQLVRDRRHEIILQPVQSHELIVGRAQLGGGTLQRTRFFFQRAGMATQLGGLVEDP